MKLHNHAARLSVFTALTLGSTVASPQIDAAQAVILAQPLESSGVSAGRQVAKTICGNCHEINPMISQRAKIGPRFEDIANLLSTTAISLKAFLRSNHNRMPNFILSSADTDDVIAYILSLKRQ
jgi:mono/diheme cytochrome c family protein